MSKFYKSVSDKFSQYPKGSIYEHTFTERTPNGNSGLRDSKGYDSKILSTLLQDPRYFEPVNTTGYKYLVEFTIDVKRTDNKKLNSAENAMVRKMSAATKDAIAKIMTEYGQHAKKDLGDKTVIY